MGYDYTKKISLISRNANLAGPPGFTLLPYFRVALCGPSGTGGLEQLSADPRVEKMSGFGCLARHTLTGNAHIKRSH